jgi:hypothetical protein
VGRLKVFSVLFTIIFLFCVLICPVSAEHPFKMYMPTPISEDNVPASAVFIFYYNPVNDTYYTRYMYSTVLNNNLVYLDTSSYSDDPVLLFKAGDYFSFSFPRSDLSWSYKGTYAYNTGVLDNVSINWILENAMIFCNVDIVDDDENVLFNRNAQIIDGLLIPNNYTGGTGGTGGVDPEVPDYDTWYDNIFSGITGWFGGVLDVLATPFALIADGLQGVWQAVTNLVTDFVEELKSLFIPSVDILPLIQDEFTDKFPIVNQVSDLFTSLFNPGSNEPIFQITYNGMTLKIIDFTMFSGYMPLVRNFTGVFLLLSFLTREVKRLPKLIRGRD